MYFLLYFFWLIGNTQNCLFLPSIDVYQAFDLLTPEGGGIGFGWFSWVSCSFSALLSICCGFPAPIWALLPFSSHRLIFQGTEFPLAWTVSREISSCSCCHHTCGGGDATGLGMETPKDNQLSSVASSDQGTEYQERVGALMPRGS